MAGHRAFESLDLPRAIAERAAAAGVEIQASAARALARHALAVLEDNPRLHLTSIEDPESFLERHLREAFEGAALVPAGASGLLVDLGSGNGYPGLPVAAARPGLRLVLVDRSKKKAAFLRRIVRETRVEGAFVVERDVERSSDLEELGPIRVLVVRAVGGWERILPKLASCLGVDGRLLLWGGPDVEKVARRASWRVLEILERRALPERDRSWVWEFSRAR